MFVDSLELPVASEAVLPICTVCMPCAPAGEDRALTVDGVMHLGRKNDDVLSHRGARPRLRLPGQDLQQQVETVQVHQVRQQAQGVPLQLQGSCLQGPCGFQRRADAQKWQVQQASDAAPALGQML